MMDQETGLKLQWVHITYGVKNKDRTVKRILNNVTGEAKPAELTYIMVGGKGKGGVRGGSSPRDMTLSLGSSRDILIHTRVCM